MSSIKSRSPRNSEGASYSDQDDQERQGHLPDKENCINIKDPLQFMSKDGEDDKPEQPEQLQADDEDKNRDSEVMNDLPSKQYQSGEESRDVFRSND